MNPILRLFKSLFKDNSSKVLSCVEKPRGDGNWINGGFFVLEPEVLDMIEGDETIWEEGPLQKLTEINELLAYKHDGFWRPMDTLRDKRQLEELWNQNQAPWRVWD